METAVMFYFLLTFEEFLLISMYFFYEGKKTVEAKLFVL